MKKSLLMVALFLTTVVFAADKGTWTGYISDSHCGAKGNNDGHAACAKKCIKDGALPVFVVGDKVYAINNPDKVSKYIGQKVTITGTITDDKLDIEKVASSK